MKKFIYSLLAFVFVLPLALGFVGCKSGELKNSDVVGDWYTESVVYTEEGEDAKTYTYERFNELHTKESKTATETSEYQALLNFFFKYKVTDDGKLQYATYAENAQYTDCGTWEIKDNKLNVTVDETKFGSDTVTTEYKNSKIIVTVVGDDFTTVITLAKVA